MDKHSKLVLKYPNQKGGCDYCVDFGEDIEKMAANLNVDVENLRANIRYLHDNGYIDYQNTSSGFTYSFSLSHKGIYWRGFRNQERLKYIRDKWTDILATIISLIALIVSIIALLQ